MKLMNSIILFTCIALILGLTGCASYKAQPLKKLDQQFSSNKQEQFISFACHVFTKGDCKRFIDRDVISRGYQPIQITFTNNSNRYLNFSTEMFSFSCIDSEEVAEKVFTSTRKRVASYGVASLFIPALIIPAVVDGISSAEANKRLSEDFYQKTLRDQIVKPFRTINGLIFVPTDNFNQKFNFTIFDTENREKLLLSTTSPKLKIKNQFLKKQSEA